MTSDRPVLVGVAHRAHQCQAFGVRDGVVGDVVLDGHIGDGIELGAGVQLLEVVLFQVQQLEQLVELAVDFLVVVFEEFGLSQCHFG